METAMISKTVIHKLRIAYITAIVVVVTLSALFLSGASAAPAAGYSLGWWTLDAGGGVSSAGSYQLSGAVAQPDAASMAGGTYQLQGGFWQAQTYFIHLPLVVR
jgi:hypothetical protein